MQIYLLRTIDELKEDLKDAKVKIHKAEMERSKAMEQLDLIKSQSMTKRQDLYSSRESISSIRSQGDRNYYRSNQIDENLTRKQNACEKKYSSMPRSSRMGVINETQVSVGTSISDLARETGK